MSKGVLIFAFNNEQIDYEKIAKLNALMIKYNMDVPVHIITDAGTDVLIMGYDGILLSYHHLTKL